MQEKYKDIENGNCQRYGFCRLDPKLNALYELLMREVMQSAFYIVKVKELGGEPDLGVLKVCVDMLCLNFTSINFNENDFVEIFNDFLKSKNKMKSLYKKINKEKQAPFETFMNEVNKKYKSIRPMIEEGERIAEGKNRRNENSELLEIVYLLAKNASLNINKIKDFMPDFQDFDFEVLKFLNLANFKTTRQEKIRRKIEEFLGIYFEILKELNKVYEKAYGEKTASKVSVNIKEGKGILVSGDNLKELEGILEKTKDEEINVYTNDLLILAHMYPKFRNYKNLKGHFGGNSPYDDFTSFEGVIFTTRNYEQQTDSIIRANIFSSNPLTPKGITKIKERNYMPLIEACKKRENCPKNGDEEYFDIKYSKKEIGDILDKNSEVCIYIGNYKKVENKNNEIQLEIPTEIDLLLELFKRDLKDKKIKIYFSRCYIHILIIAFILKVKLSVDIYFKKCPDYSINPHFINCLKEQYGIKFES